MEPRIKTTMTSLRLLGAMFVILLALTGMLPIYPGLLVIALTLTIILLQMCFPNSYAGQNVINISLSVSPIWMLYLDPCALVFTQVLSFINVRNIVIDENREKYKKFYFCLTLVSWLVVIIFENALFGECSSTISFNRQRDSIIILLAVYLHFSAIQRQSSFLVNELKDSLTEVKALNSRLEGLNKELKQSLDAKDNFILLFSHETRNPLNILIGNLSLLLSEVVDTQYKTKLERCKFCADLLLQQLNNILDSGKLANRGTLELSPTPVNLNEYIQSISSFMEMLIKKKGAIKAEVIIPESLPRFLRFDMQRLTQVCLNLLTNGLKFTEAGRISLVIRYLRKDAIQESDYYPSTDFGYQLLSSSNKKEKEAPESLHEIGDEIDMDTQIGYKRQFTREIANLEIKKKSFVGVDKPEKGYLKIEINDTGCGIKPDDIKKLFKKFSQTHSDAAQLKIGSGLGLWITKSLCELMGGDVRAYSVPNIGSCFVAIIQADCLPSTRSRASASQTLPNSSPVKDPNPKRILLVDDDPFNLEFHTQIIKSLGYHSIETAINGQELVEQFKAKPEGYFEAVITDISMPILDGIEAAKLIRKHEENEKRLSRVKIGFITGHSNSRDKLTCEKAPLNCLFYLSKPIKPTLLEGFLPSLFVHSHSITLSTKEPLSTSKIVHSRSLKTQPLQRASTSYSFSPLVLCVDDDVFNLDFLEEMIKSLGARAIKAKSGEEGLAIMKSAMTLNVKENIPRLVLMDCRMPKMDGWTASKMMKEMLKKEFGMEVPIIGVTGEEKEHNLEKFNTSGMDEIIQKPIQREELQMLIKKLRIFL